MRDLIRVTGMVLSAMPVGEFDKRIEILTRERGKIAVFAKGARRPNSLLLGPSRPMAFGTFEVYEGRTSYNLKSGEIKTWFDELTRDLEGLGYSAYFLEVAAAYSMEAMDGTQVLLLLYQSMKALIRKRIPALLIRYCFELRMMVINGEYTLDPPFETEDSTRYALYYMGTAPMEKLYSFTVSEKVLEELGQCMQIFRHKFLEGSFTSLDILKSLE